MAKQTVQEIIRQLKSMADDVRAAQSARYFKSGKGEYGEGDRFMGIRVPDVRALAKKYEAIALEEVYSLLQSDWHEARLLALHVLVRKFEKADAQLQAAIFDLYLQNMGRVNNWDLVDTSASQIVGRYLESRDRKLLYKLARSAVLWERRIAIIATFQFIRSMQFDDSFKLAELLLRDREDLIHKAVGWMLREIGKRNLAAEQAFLKMHYQKMPRTMLRYAIEKFPQDERKRYLNGTV